MIYATTTFYEGFDLLPHWLKHYTKLGVDRILVLFGVRQGQEEMSADAHRQVTELCRHFPAGVHPFTYDAYRCTRNVPLRKWILAEAGATETDWVVYADLDEFYSYPSHLRDIIEDLESEKTHAVRGEILDRVSENGELTAIQPNPDLGTQYPLGCKVTGPLCHGGTSKIMLCRATVNVDGAQAVITKHKDTTAVTGLRGRCVAHHFRWTASLKDRLMRRLEDSAIGPGYRREIRVAMDSILQVGRVPIENTKLRTRHLGALTYPKQTGHSPAR